MPGWWLGGSPLPTAAPGASPDSVILAGGRLSRLRGLRASRLPFHWRTTSLRTHLPNLGWIAAETAGLGRFVRGGFADVVEGGFDELFALVATEVIDGRHGLHGFGGGAGKIEGAIDHFAFGEEERAVAQNHHAAVAEFAGGVFVEVEQDFFIHKLVFDDFHEIWGLMDAGNGCHSARGGGHQFMLKCLGVPPRTGSKRD